MIEISAIIYFAINIFLAGYYLGSEGKWNSKFRNFLSFVLYITIGLPFLILYLICVFTENWLEPVINEIRFSYRFYLTKYFNNIYLNDNYSDVFKSREEKLKRTEELSKNSSKQMKRHNKLIQNKYGRS